MSNYFQGVTFPWQEITAADDAIVRRAALPDRRLSGCELTYSGNAVVMAAGAMLVCGRQFWHKTAQSWSLTGASSGYARLLLTIDVTKASTEDAFEQISVSVEYATTADGFPVLRQDDINTNGVIYQVVICIVSLNNSVITGFVSELISGPISVADLNALSSFGGVVNGKLIVNGDFKVGTNGVTLWESTTEGGNIQFAPPKGGTADYWEMDAYDGNLRIRAQKNATHPNGAGNVTALKLFTDGHFETGNPSVSREKLGAAPTEFVLANANSYEIKDALNINLTNPYGTQNKMGYVMSGVTSAMPSGLSYGIREVFYRSNEWVIVKITGWDSYSYSPCVVYNQYRGSSIGWTGWEWENPPLQPNTEYKTTMRRRGQPIYVKLVDFGALPASGVSNVKINIGGGQICYTKASAFSNSNGEYQPFPMMQNGALACYHWVDNSGYLNVQAIKNVSDNYAVFEIYYTKS